MTDCCGLILMYHHVSETRLNPTMLNVRPVNFAEQMEVIHREAHPMRLHELQTGLKQGALPQRAVAVTFDDGYGDNLWHALPKLEQHDFPATMFVATGGANPTEFWWDELERLLLMPGQLSETVEIPLPTEKLRFEIGDAAIYDRSAYERDRDWRVWEEAPTPRQAVYQTLCPVLKRIGPIDLARAMEALRASAKPGPAGPARRLTVNELETIHRGGLVRIGSHTVAHPMLSTLSVSEQYLEIEQARKRLEEVLGTRVDQFAYPYGDYTQDTLEILRRGSIGCACSTKIGNVRAGCDAWRLPRHNVFDLDGDAFSEWMHGVWQTG